MNSSHILAIIARCKATVLCIYPYGSRVYGTNHDGSDYDYIAVIDSDEQIYESTSIPDLNIEFTIYSKALFQQKISEHEISVLECLFVADAYNPQNIKFEFVLDKPQLRKAISSKSSNSWVKTKKKFIIAADYDPYIGLKSLFHSLRILMFGSQLATQGRIHDFSTANHIWTELNQKAINDWDWPALELQYKTYYNNLCSSFRLLAPKE